MSIIAIAGVSMTGIPHSGAALDAIVPNLAARASKPTPGHLIVGKTITLPRALYLAGSASSLVNASQATEVATTMWKLWEQALVDSDTRGLSELIVPGPVLAATINNCAYPQGTCVPETKPRTFTELLPIVPLQHTYPIYFLAEIRTTQYVQNANGLSQWEPWMELQILTKSSASSSWKLSFDSGYAAAEASNLDELPFQATPAGPIVEPVGGQDLYNLTPDRSWSVPTAQFLARLATYWQSYKDAGHGPSRPVFVNGGSTSGVGQGLAADRQGSIYLGHRETFQFSADPGSSSWVFSVQGDYPMVCGSVVDLASDTAPSGSSLNQNSDETNYGISLPPGEYSQITTTAVHQVCVYPVQGGLDVAGNEVLPAEVTGKRVAGAPLPDTDPVVSDLETAYGVLAYQLVQYEQQLAACELSSRTACTKKFATNAALQFAMFSQQLSQAALPSSTKGDVAALNATTLRLNAEFEQLSHGSADLRALGTEIEDNALVLNGQYATLVDDLTKNVMT